VAQHDDVEGGGSDLELTVGEEVTIELPSLAMAGYRWRHEINGGSSIAEVTWRSGSLPADESMSVGRSAPEIAVIRGIGIGEVNIAFLQQRPWESEREPREVLPYRVRVRPRVTESTEA
jgi:predicted secreted protein